MIKLRKLTFLLAAIFLFAGIFAACGSSKQAVESTSASAASQQQESSQGTELTGLAATWPEFAKRHEVQVLCTEMGWTGPEKDKDFVTPEIAARTNMQIIYEPLTCANTDAYKQKVNLMAAGGEVPDVFMGAPDAFSQNIYKMLGKNGLIWDIGPLIKDYKNISALLEPELIMYRDPETKANHTLPAQTGRGAGDTSGGVPNGIYIRQDWLNKFGMSYPSTPEELYTYFKRCKDEIKTVNGKSVIPLTFDENLDHMDSRFLASIFCPLNYYSDMDPANYTGFTLAVDPKENKVVNYGFTDSPELMTAAKFLNKLYRDGLLDKEVLTQKRLQFEEKISSGRVGMHIAPVWDVKGLTDSAKTVVPDLMYVVTPAFKTPGVPKYTDTKYTNYVGASDLLFFSKKLDEETVRHFLAMLDYLTTKEGQLLVQYGVEGKSFTIGSDGILTMTEQFKKDTSDLDWNKQAAYGVQYWQQLVTNWGVVQDVQPRNNDMEIPENKMSYDNRKAVVVDKYDMNMMPTKGYYLNAGEIETKKLPAIEDAKLVMWASVIKAKSEAEVEDVIHAWAKNCKNLGIDEIVAERQKFLDTFDISAQN